MPVNLPEDGDYLNAIIELPEEDTDHKKSWCLIKAKRCMGYVTMSAGEEWMSANKPLIQSVHLYPITQFTLDPNWQMTMSQYESLIQQVLTKAANQYAKAERVFYAEIDKAFNDYLNPLGVYRSNSDIIEDAIRALVGIDETPTLATHGNGHSKDSMSLSFIFANTSDEEVANKLNSRFGIIETNKPDRDSRAGEILFSLSAVSIKREMPAIQAKCVELIAANRAKYVKTQEPEVTLPEQGMALRSKRMKM